MSTAVKMDEDAKSKLEALQAEIRLKTGKSHPKRTSLKTDSIGGQLTYGVRRFVPRWNRNPE